MTELNTAIPITDEEIDLREILIVLNRSKGLVAILIAAAVAAAALLSYLILPKTYESSLAVALPSLVQVDVEQKMSPERIQALALSDQVLQGVIKQTGSEMTVRELLEEDRFRTAWDAKTNLLTVTASGPSPEAAHQLAAAWLDTFSEYLFTYFGKQVEQQLQIIDPVVTRQREYLQEMEEELQVAQDKESLAAIVLTLSYGQQYLRLKSEQDQLEILRDQLPEMVNIAVIRAPAVPEGPVSPQPLLNMAVAAVLAGMLGVFGVFLKEAWARGKRPPAQ